MEHVVGNAGYILVTAQVGRATRQRSRAVAMSLRNISLITKEAKKYCLGHQRGRILPDKDKEYILYALDGLIKSAKLQTL